MNKSWIPFELISPTKHLRSKVIILLLACLCWFLVRTERTIEVDFQFPLVLDYSAVPSLVPIEDPPEEVSVRLRGKGRSLLFYALFQKGEYRLRLEGSERHNTSSKHLDLQITREFAVISIHPTLLYIELDSLKSKRVPLHFLGQIEVHEDYLTSSDITMEPRMVGLSGPKHILDTLSVITTEWTRFDRVKRDVEKVLRLVSPANSLQLVRDEATVKLKVDKRVRRTFSDVYMQILNQPDSIRLETTFCSADLQGAERLLQDFDGPKAYIDYRDYDRGLYCAPCSLSFPVHFELVKLQPTCLPKKMLPIKTENELADSTQVSWVRP
jgi:hypothetical protein